MKRLSRYLSIAAILLSSCSTPTQLQVTKLGFESSEALEKVIYALPRTMLKVHVQYERHVRVPGPYGQYGEKYLGLQNCITERSETWSLQHCRISEHTEIDPDHYYTISALSGKIPYETYTRLLSDGLITDGKVSVSEEISVPIMQSRTAEQSVVFTDVTLDPYVSERQETMFKTIVTDTSYVKVPVSRTVIEKKTHEQKAREAADFILELRLSRFELLSGYGEVFPDGEAMEATIRKIDQLEMEYLSLFTGKQYTESFSREFYILPEPGADTHDHLLGYFSGDMGFVPATHEEGDPLALRVESSDVTRSVRNLMPQVPEEEVYNTLYYRLPDVADVTLLYQDRKIYHKRVNVYQLGAMVSMPVAF